MFHSLFNIFSSVQNNITTGIQEIFFQEALYVHWTEADFPQAFFFDYQTDNEKVKKRIETTETEENAELLEIP